MMEKRVAVVYAIAIILLCTAGSLWTVSYLAELTHSPPPLAPNAPLLVMFATPLEDFVAKDFSLNFTIRVDVYWANGGWQLKPNARWETLIFKYTVVNQTFMWVAGNSDHWVIVKVVDGLQGRPVWLWNPGDHVTLTFLRSSTLMLCYESKR